MTNDGAPVRLRIRIYIAGDAPNSVAAVTNLRAAVSQIPEGGVELEVIDLLKTPQRGMEDGVFVAPLLVKLEPPPERRLLGSLHDRRLLLSALDLEERA